METYKYIDAKKNANVDYRYFVYIDTNIEIIGLDNLSEESLQRVIEAFAYGRESFLISGKRYFFNEPHEIRIFKIDVNLCPDFSIERVGSNRLKRQFYTPDFLATKGEEVTDEFIKGDFGWKVDIRPFSSGYVQTLGETKEVFIGLETSHIVQDKINASIKNRDVTKSIKHSNKIFIVHGHDEAAKHEVARFVEKLGLEAIILHEQINQGQTIIEKIESFSDVGYAIILYTPCDRGGLNQDNSPLMSRARQNVVFEHGYFTAKLGRNRVMSLVKDGVDTPGDLSGVVYTPMDNNDAWKLKIAQELKALGYKIDFNKVFY